jgi:Domain of unknown function (DUF4218)
MYSWSVFSWLLLETLFQIPYGISSFFREICSIKLDANHIEQLEKNIVVTMCKLEKHFLSRFFDSVEHLVVHVAYEAIMGWSIDSRWMYPCKRCVLFQKKNLYYIMRYITYILLLYLNNMNESK